MISLFLDTCSAKLIVGVYNGIDPIVLNIEENDSRVMITAINETTEEVEVKEEVAVTTEASVATVKNEKEEMYKSFMKKAHESADIKEKVENFENAIKVSSEMINKDGEVTYWKDETTKPYMIALQDLGNALNENKDYDDAIKVYELLLGLNPLDNQGIRYKLVNILIKRNSRKEINELFKKYSTPSTFFIKKRGLSGSEYV